MGGLHLGGCALSKDSAGVKCTQWIVWLCIGMRHGFYPLTQWAPSRLKKIRHAILLVASVYSHWPYGLWLR